MLFENISLNLSTYLDSNIEVTSITIQEGNIGNYVTVSVNITFEYVDKSKVLGASIDLPYEVYEEFIQPFK